MNNYKTYTNSELEEELGRLKRDYELAQKVVLENYQLVKAVLENYQLMMELAEQYGEAEDVLNTRTGKKKEG